MLVFDISSVLFTYIIVLKIGLAEVQWSILSLQASVQLVQHLLIIRNDTSDTPVQSESQ